MGATGPSMVTIALMSDPEVTSTDPVRCSPGIEIRSYKHSPTPEEGSMRYDIGRGVPAIIVAYVSAATEVATETARYDVQGRTASSSRNDRTARENDVVGCGRSDGMAARPRGWTRRRVDGGGSERRKREWDAIVVSFWRIGEEVRRDGGKLSSIDSYAKHGKKSILR
jgi:hypothetical protein